MGKPEAGIHQHPHKRIQLRMAEEASIGIGSDQLQSNSDISRREHD